MALDPNLVTTVMANWQTPQPFDPLSQIAKIQALKNGAIQQSLAQQQLQNEQLQYQTQQRALSDQQALDAAYRGAITTDANGNISYDRAKVLSNVPGHLAPGIQKTLTEMDQAKATLDETQAKARTDQVNLLGNMLLPIVDSGYDPTTFKSVVTHAAGTGALDPHQASAWLQKLGPDPTPDQIKGALAPYLGAPAVQELLTKRQTAQAATDRATAAKQQADLATEKERVAKVNQAKQALGAATDQASLDQGIKNVIVAGATPDEVKQLPRMFSPAAMDAYNASLQTAQERAQTAGQAATLAETKKRDEEAQRHNKIQESIEVTRNQLQQTAARGDRSYQSATHELDTIGKPVTDAVARLGRLQDTLAQNSPQADALVAPELLSVMAGGSGSGLRMNDAEITRIVGGRSKWEDLKAAVNKWQLDPSKATSITPEQRKEIRDLTSTVSDKLYAKQNALDAAYKAVAGSQDPNEHRQAVLTARQAISAADMPGGAAGAAPSLPSRLAATDVGKTFTNSSGQRIKVTAVNPADPTKFKYEAAQ